MPVTKGTALDPAATRARLLDAATGLFHERGVHAVGVSEVASAAGSSKLSLYRYFPSKHELVAAVLAERSERIHAWLRRETAGAPPGPGRVLALFDLLIFWFAQPGYRGCAVINAATDTRGDNDPDTTRLARRHLRRYRELLTERLTEAGLGPEDAAQTARRLLLLIEGATVVTAIDGPATTAGTDARATAELILAATIEPT
jgi:AcrR family transcriptional regulator